MDETTLIGRLGALRPPDAELARSRALERVPARVAAARLGGGHTRARLRLRLASVAAVVLATLVALSFLTAPGQAFTSWVGDRLGLGQPGGHPALQSLRGWAMRGTGGAGQPAFVLARGSGRRGVPYEFITYRVRPQPGKEWPANGARCFQLEFPRDRGLMDAGCGLPAASGGLLFRGIGGNSQPGSAYRYASGLVSADVAAVEVAINGHPIPVELKPIPASLIARFQIRRPFKFFIAFFGPGPGRLTVTARDAAGRRLAERTAALPPPMPLGSVARRR
ncbi:MAG: hypothetical protein JST31_02510 [Actinobacteria bacterium]|nr:hypothetical protein [Actinomycetota bacterium]